jgi:F-type H+-transporting ATPase subunit epsilon
MTLKVLLPFQVFSQTEGISRIVAESPQGSFGLLPQRLDCVVALVPGIFLYENSREGEVFLAIDQGVLIKTGMNVTISVRDAMGGTKLESLRDVVESRYLNLSEQERNTRSLMAKLEREFIRRFAEFDHEY